MAAGGPAPIDDDVPSGRINDILRMKVAVADCVSDWQRSETGPRSLLFLRREVRGGLDPAVDPLALRRQLGRSRVVMKLSVQLGQSPHRSRQLPRSRLDLPVERL